MATLVFVLEDEREINVPLEGTVTLGSSEDNDVVVDDTTISPNHAVLEPSAQGGYILRDLRSDGGTYVNGHRIQSQSLHHGDDLSFGLLRGRFEMPQQLQASLAAAPSVGRSGGARPPSTDTAPIVPPGKPVPRVAPQEPFHLEIHSKQEHLINRLKALEAQEQQKMLQLDQLHRQTTDAASTLAAIQAQTRDQKERMGREAVAAQAITQRSHETALADQQMHIQRLQLEITGLDQQREAKEAGIQEAEKRLQELRAAVQNQEQNHQAVSDTQAALKEGQEKLEGLLAEIAIAESRSEELKHILKDASAREEEARSTQQRLEELRTSVQSYEQQQQALLETQSALKEHQSALQEHQSKLEAILAEVAIAESRRDELQSAVTEAAATAAQLQEAQKRLQELQLAVQNQEEQNQAVMVTQAALKDSRDKLETLLAEIAIAESRKDSLNQLVEETTSKQAALAELLEREQKASGSLESTQQEITSAQSRLEELKAVLADHGNQTEALARTQKEIIDAKAELEIAKAELGGWETQRLSLQESVNGFEKQNSHLEQQARERQEHLAKTLVDLETAEARLEELKATTLGVEEQKQKLAEISGALGQAQSELEASRSELQGWESKRTILAGDIEAFSHRHNQLQTEVQERETLLAQLYATCQEAEGRKIQLTAEVADLDEKQRHLAETNQQILETQGRLEAVKADFQGWQAQRKSLETNIADLERAHHDLQGRLKQTNQELAAKETSVQETNAQLEELKALVVEFEERNHQLKFTNDSIHIAQEQLSSLTTAITTFENQRQSLQQTLAAFEQQGQNAQLELQQARAELARANEQREVLARIIAENAEAESIRDELRSEVTKLQGHRELLDQMLEGLQNTRVESELELTRIGTAILRANEDLHQTEALKLDAEQGAARFRDEEERLHQALLVLRGEQDQVMASLSARRQDHTAMEARVAELTNTSHELTAAISNKKVEQQRLEQTLANLERQRIESESVLQAEQEALHQANSSLKLVEAKVKDAEGRVQHLLEQEAALAGTSDSLSTAQNHLAQLHTETGNLETTRQSLEHAISGLEKQQREMQTQLTLREQEVAMAVQALNETRGQNEKLRLDGKALEQAQAKLEGEIKARQASLADLDKRHQENMNLMRQRENNLAMVSKSLEQSELLQQNLKLALQALGSQQTDAQVEVQRLTATRDSRLSEIESLNVQRQQLDAQVQSLTHEAATGKARAAELQVLVQAREDQIKTSESKYIGAEQRRKDLEQRIVTLSGTEEKLVLAKQQLRQAEDAYANLVALNSKFDERKTEFSALEKRLELLRNDEKGTGEALTAQQKALQQLMEQSEAAKQRQRAEGQALDKQLQASRDALASANKQLHEVTAKHEELLHHNRRLEGAEQKHAEMLAKIKQMDQQTGDMTNRLRKLEQEQVDAQARLNQTKAIEQAAQERLDALRKQESPLKQSLQDLQAAQQTERQRFEEMRTINQDAERHAAQHRAQLQAAQDEMRQEIVDLEGRLSTLHSYKEDLDLRYARLAALPENSPEARELWKDIQRAKEEIAAKMPAKGGIIARAQTRSVVVPRGGQRPD